MATWLGHRTGNWERTERTHSLPWLCQLLLRLPSGKNWMRPPITVAAGQNQGTLPSILCQTDADHNHLLVFHQFHRSASFESVFGADPEHIRDADKSEQCYRKRFPANYFAFGSVFPLKVSSNFQILFGLTALAGTSFCVIIAKFISKRLLYMMSISIAIVTNLWLGKYAIMHSAIFSVARVV